MPVVSPRKLFDHVSAPQVIQHKHGDQRNLTRQPEAVVADAVTEPQPQTRSDGQYPARCRDTKVEFALHDLELVLGRTVSAHGVVNKEPWKVEKTRKPGDHENDM